MVRRQRGRTGGYYLTCPQVGAPGEPSPLGYVREEEDGEGGGGY